MYEIANITTGFAELIRLGGTNSPAVCTFAVAGEVEALAFPAATRLRASASSPPATCAAANRWSSGRSAKAGVGHSGRSLLDRM